MRKLVKGRRGREREVRFQDCCGTVCDDRCWGEAAVRQHQRMDPRVVPVRMA